MSTSRVIPEAAIELVYAEVSISEQEQEKRLRAFVQAQPHLTAWLLGDSFELLTEEERDYLFFLGMILFECCKRYFDPLPEVDGDHVREAEEHNWLLLEGAGEGGFSKRITVLFADSTQEDLLAFVEDALAEDDEENEPIVTKVGREPMFVALKSVVDVLLP